MNKTNIIFWQNILSHHQSSVLRTMSCDDIYKVTLVCEKAEDIKRKAMGWPIPDFGNTEIIIQPSDQEIQNILCSRDDTINIFSGINSYCMVKKAFLYCIKNNKQIGLYSESYNYLGCKGKIRIINSIYERMLYGRHIKFILAIGELGEQYFRICGYSDDKVFQYAYYVEPACGIENKTLHKNIFDICYIGQLIERKGVDKLVKSLERNIHHNWHLHMIGDGPLKSELQKIIDNLYLTDKITLYGNKDYSFTMDLLSKSDLLVLPSKWDGWGAVVNEALIRGVPVICSDHCGSSVLIKYNDILGELFHYNDESELALKLNKCILRGKLNSKIRSEIKKKSEIISPRSGVDYFYNIITELTDRSKKCKPPWK